MRSAFIAVSLILVAACGQDAAPAADAGAASAPSASAPPSSTAPADRELQPVYPIDDQPPLPLAEKYCGLYTVEIARTKECCDKGSGATAAVQKECVRTLSAALRGGALTLAEEDVDKCAAAHAKAVEGCDWVDLKPPLLPDACIGIMHGTVAEGQLCRSSLECAGELHCFGLGAVRPGKCGKPHPAGKSCGPSVDTLATLTRQHRWEHYHPTCAGACVDKLCTDELAVGAACKHALSCGRGKYCKDGACAEGDGAAEGESCKTSTCLQGLRCVKGTCVALKASGEACTSDEDCRGRCNKPDGEKEGTCDKACPGTQRLTPPVDRRTVDLPRKRPPKKK